MLDQTEDLGGSAEEWLPREEDVEYDVSIDQDPHEYFFLRCLR